MMLYRLYQFIIFSLVLVIMFLLIFSLFFSAEDPLVQPKNIKEGFDDSLFDIEHNNSVIMNQKKNKEDMKTSKDNDVDKNINKTINSDSEFIPDEDLVLYFRIVHKLSTGSDENNLDGDVLVKRIFPSMTSTTTIATTTTTTTTTTTPLTTKTDSTTTATGNEKTLISNKNIIVKPKLLLSLLKSNESTVGVLIEEIPILTSDIIIKHCSVVAEENKDCPNYGNLYKDIFNERNKEYLYKNEILISSIYLFIYEKYFKNLLSLRIFVNVIKNYNETASLLESQNILDPILPIMNRVFVSEIEITQRIQQLSFLIEQLLVDEVSWPLVRKTFSFNFSQISAPVKNENELDRFKLSVHKEFFKYSNFYKSDIIQIYQNTFFDVVECGKTTKGKRIVASDQLKTLLYHTYYYLTKKKVPNFALFDRPYFETSEEINSHKYPTVDSAKTVIKTTTRPIEENESAINANRSTENVNDEMKENLNVFSYLHPSLQSKVWTFRKDVRGYGRVSRGDLNTHINQTHILKGSELLNIDRRHWNGYEDNVKIHRSIEMSKNQNKNKDDGHEDTIKIKETDSHSDIIQKVFRLNDLNKAMKSIVLLSQG